MSKDKKEPVAKNFGEWIKAARLAAGLKQRQAAALARTSQPTWNRYEHDANAEHITVEVARRVCEAVGLDLADFLKDRPL